MASARVGDVIPPGSEIIEVRVPELRRHRDEPAEERTGPRHVAGPLVHGSQRVPEAEVVLLRLEDYIKSEGLNQEGECLLRVRFQNLSKAS